MKHLICILFFFVIGFAACQRHAAYPPVMQQAESLMNTRPDSAWQLLQGMEDTVPMLSEEALMYWHLLGIQARDKLYITHNDDSLINRIVQFYEASDDKDRLMMAYFYQGATYRDMNDAPRALKAYQQAVDLNVPNLDLLAKIYNQMGTLFMYQGLHDEVIRVNRKGIEAYFALGKRNKISYAQRDIARMYDVKNIPDSALYYYKEACHTALMDNDSVRYYNILGELGGFFYEQNMAGKAKSTLLKVIKYRQNPQKNASLYLSLGHVYYMEENLDSAYHYYQKTLAFGDFRQSCYAYQCLYWLESQRENYQMAEKYIKQSLRMRDSINAITQTETIAKVNSLYNYQHTEAKNIQLTIKQERHRIYIVVLVLSILFLLAISFSVFFYLQKRKQKAILHEKKLKEFEMQKHEKSMAALKAVQEKMLIVNKKLENKSKESSALQDKVLLLEKELLELHDKQIRVAQEKQKLNVQLFEDMEIYKRFHEASKANSTFKISLESSEWQELIDAINQTYPQFTGRLLEIYPMSQIELRVCCLIKIGISPAGISRLVYRTRSNITLIRIRLYEKIYKKSGTSEQFDKFIEEI